MCSVELTTVSIDTNTHHSQCHTGICTRTAHIHTAPQTHLQLANVLGHVALGVGLDDELKVALGVAQGGGRVRADDLLCWVGDACVCGCGCVCECVL